MNKMNRATQISRAAGELIHGIGADIPALAVTQ